MKLLPYAESYAVDLFEEMISHFNGLSVLLLMDFFMLKNAYALVLYLVLQTSFVSISYYVSLEGVISQALRNL